MQITYTYSTLFFILLNHQIDLPIDSILLLDLLIVGISIESPFFLLSNVSVP